MGKEIKVGQKLYHFAYGPLTVTSISDDYVETVADQPSGYRGGKSGAVQRQTWIVDTIGHWLFENPSDVGKENNDFDWKKHWPDYAHEPVLPVRDAQDRGNWHPYFTGGTTTGGEISPVGIAGTGASSPVGITGTNPDGDLSPVGIKNKKSK